MQFIRGFFFYRDLAPNGIHFTDETAKESENA